MNPNNNGSYAVLHLFGRDKEGLIARVSAAVTDHQGNIEEYICHTLGNKVVFFGLVRGDEDELLTLKKALETEEFGEKDQIQAHVEPTDTRIPEGKQPIPWRVRVESEDFRGLLQVTSDFLERSSINVISAHGEEYAAPRSRWPMAFYQTFTVHVPIQFNPDDCEAAIKALDKRIRRVVVETL